MYLPGTDTDGAYTGGQVTWAPSGDWGKADSDLPHEFKVTPESAIGGIEAPPTVKRLADGQRRQIFEELIRAERKARKAAEEMFPMDFQKQNEHFEMLNSTFENSIVKTNKLTNDELSSIIKEGIQKNWSPPIN